MSGFKVKNTYIGAVNTQQHLKECHQSKKHFSELKTLLSQSASEKQNKNKQTNKKKPKKQKNKIKQKRKLGL